jgi:allantoinase
VTPTGVRAASIHIDGGRITRISDWADVTTDDDLFDAHEWIVMPGVIDTHVHVNEPGRTEWEGFETADARRRGRRYHTISTCHSTPLRRRRRWKALVAKQRSAAGQSHVNVEFIGGVVPGNARQLEPLARAGVRAFKCFLTPSGVDDFLHVDTQDLREAFPILAQLGLPLMVHAEDPACILPAPPGGSRSYATYLVSRPPDAESTAIEMMIALMDWCPTPVHIVHLSSASSLGVIRAGARTRASHHRRNLSALSDVCADHIPAGATEYKCAPPIRDAREREALWNALIAGDIDLVASDHSPCPPEMKQSDGDFFSAWGGIASLQLSLSAVWTGARTRGVEPARLSEWMCAGPARLAGLTARAGALVADRDADIVIWDPDASYVVNPTHLRHRHPVTPYAGRELFGVVRATYVGGRRVFHDSSLETPSRS